MIELLPFLAEPVKSCAIAIAGAVARHAVNKKLEEGKIQQFLKGGIEAAEAWDKERDVEEHLFFRCKPDFIGKFFGRFFQYPGVTQELEKPIAKEEMPQVAFLVEAFKQALAGYPEFAGKIDEERIEPWLKGFAENYFAKTSAYLKLEIAWTKFRGRRP